MWPAAGAKCLLAGWLFCDGALNGTGVALQSLMLPPRSDLNDQTAVSVLYL